MIKTLEQMIDEYTNEYVRFVSVSGDTPEEDKISDELETYVEDLYIQIHDKLDTIMQVVVKEKLKK